MYILVPTQYSRTTADVNAPHWPPNSRHAKELSGKMSAYVAAEIFGFFFEHFAAAHMHL